MKVGDDAFSDEKIRVRILTLGRVKMQGKNSYPRVRIAG